MKQHMQRIVIAWACGTLLATAGCQSGAPGARFLSFFGLSKEPVVIALMGQPIGDLNPFGPYEPLRKALDEQLGRPVQLRLGLEMGLEPNLKLGLYQFAFVTPAVYGNLKDPNAFEVVAIAEGMDGSLARPGLLVVPVDSDIAEVEQLRGQSVAFGPLGDNRTHLAAMALLESHGITKADLDLPLGALSGSLKHAGPAKDVLNSIKAGKSAAGFVDAAAFQALPATSSDEAEVAQSQFRVVAETLALPDALVIASPKSDPQVVVDLGLFLHESGTKNAEELRSLRVAGYAPAETDVIKNCRRLCASEPRPGDAD